MSRLPAPSTSRVRFVAHWLLAALMLAGIVAAGHLCRPARDAGAEPGYTEPTTSLAHRR